MTLLQGDCLDLIKDIPNESIDLVLTDIPYNVSRENNFKTMKDRKGRQGIDFGDWDYEFDESRLSYFIPKLRNGGSFIVFHAFEQFDTVRNTLKALELKDKLIWEKSNPMPRNRDRRYISNIEMFSWYVKGNKKWTFNRQNTNYDGCVLLYPSESGGAFKRYHPCQKNYKMLEEIIKRHTNPDDIVLDPFMGSGSTGVACKNTNRHFIGIELDEKYFNIAKERLHYEQIC
jgi:site-specific DNA-methyltransferase (adenine-specific)